MSLPDVFTVDKEGNSWLGLWISNPVRAKCGKCKRGAFYYSSKLKKKCGVCKHKVEYRYPGFWKGIPPWKINR